MSKNLLFSFLRKKLNIIILILVFVLIYFAIRRELFFQAGDPEYIDLRLYPQLTDATEIPDQFFINKNIGDLNLNVEIYKIKIPNRIVRIGKFAFSNSDFREIVFEEGSNLSSIGEYAFLNDPKGEIFINYQGPKINNIILPKSLTIIEERAFYRTPLEQITFETPSNLESIGNYCFS